MEQWGHYRPPEFSWRPQYVICMPRDLYQGNINWALFCVPTDEVGRTLLTQKPEKKFSIFRLACFYMFSKHNKSWNKTHALCVECDTFCVFWINLHLSLKEHTRIQVSAEIVLGNEFMITANWCLGSSFEFIFLGYRSYLWKRLEPGDVVIHVRSNMT